MDIIEFASYTIHIIKTNKMVPVKYSQVGAGAAGLTAAVPLLEVGHRCLNNKLAKARKTSKPPGTLGLKKFWPGKPP